MPFWSWSQTAANNATADTTINWREGQAPSTVNNSARAMMAVLAASRDDNSGSLITTGTASVYSLTSNSNIAPASPTPPDGFFIAFQLHAAPIGASTLNVDGTGDKPLRLAPGVEIPAGALRLNGVYRATFIRATGEWILIGAFANDVPVGTVSEFDGPVAPSGYILASGRTIGNASSSATERANADTQALFTHYWNNFPDGMRTVSGGRGASAAADFAANKTITILDARGRAAVGKDDMGGTAAGIIGSSIAGTTLGAVGGEETHKLVVAEMPNHTHGVNDPGHVHADVGTQGVIANNGTAVTFQFNTGTHNTSSATTGISIQSAGSDGTHNNLQPSYITNKIIKL